MEEILDTGREFYNENGENSESNFVFFSLAVLAELVVKTLYPLTKLPCGHLAGTS